MTKIQMKYYKTKKVKTATKKSEKVDLSSLLQDKYFHFAQHLANASVISRTWWGALDHPLNPAIADQ